MAIKVGGTTVIDDSRNLVNLNSGAIVGVQSASQPVGSGATTLNFIGAGNTFSYNAVTKTLDISIQGGGSGVSTTGIATAAIFSNPQFAYAGQIFDLGETDRNYGLFGPYTVSVGATVIVGAGNTLTVV